MSKTILTTDRVAVAYIDDHQGRRLVVGEHHDGVVERTNTVATTKDEAREFVRLVRELLQELP